MSPIPSSDLLGHRVLKERIDYALDRCEEVSSIDFKQSASWDELRGKIVRTILGMGNLRDGGLIIIGVAEEDDQWRITGVSDDHRVTYEPDDMADFAAKYVSPRADFTVVDHSYQEKRFVVIHVRPFAETPLVCKRDLPSENLQAGGVYVRPTEGKAETTKVRDAAQMHQLLEMAAEERAGRMIAQRRRIESLATQGTEQVETDESREFDNELEGF